MSSQFDSYVSIGDSKKLIRGLVSSRMPKLDGIQNLVVLSI